MLWFICNSPKQRVKQSEKNDFVQAGRVVCECMEVLAARTVSQGGSGPQALWSFGLSGSFQAFLSSMVFLNSPGHLDQALASLGGHKDAEVINLLSDHLQRRCQLLHCGAPGLQSHTLRGLRGPGADRKVHPASVYPMSHQRSDFASKAHKM